MLYRQIWRMGKTSLTKRIMLGRSSSLFSFSLVVCLFVDQNQGCRKLMYEGKCMQKMCVWRRGGGDREGAKSQSL